jgi:hypothetical protein
MPFSGRIILKTGSSRAITPEKTRRRDSGALMPGLAGLFNRRTGRKRTDMIWIYICQGVPGSKPQLF